MDPELRTIPLDVSVASESLTPAKARSPWYAWYVLAVLTVVYSFSVIDRNFLSLLQEPIRKELGLSDTQLGTLTGLAFALFYATLAIPLARLADRSNRKVIVGLAIGLWSVMTGVCGLARGFLGLALARVGVGVGEAGGYPSAASILSDYFARDRRATALAIFGIGPPIGSMLGLFIGGWLNDAVGWRMAFVVVAAAGFLVSPIVLFTVREPKKGASEADRGAVDSAVGANTWAVVRVLWKLKAFRYLLVANILHCFVSYAYNAWTPPFYGRVYHIATGKLGLYLGLLAGAGALGTYVGGHFADRFGRRDARWYVWVLGLASALAIPAAALQFMVGDARASLIAAALPSFLLLVWVGPTIAVGQSLASPHMRATTAAITLAAVNIFGLALGPFLVGVLSDYLRSGWRLGPDSIRFALLAAFVLEGAAALFYFLSGRHLERDLNRDRTQDFA